MKEYSNIISLCRNGRGVYCIDTTMGCASGMAYTPGGCYGDCYAAKAAKRYGQDFTKTILRHFKDEKHKREIVLKISKIKLDFIRIGCSGDPSENWEHTIDCLKTISKGNKHIVIITRHWDVLTDEYLQYLSGLNISINTSVSALDPPELMYKCLSQYNRIKQYCNSILRVVSCDFNLENETGKRLSEIQHSLFKNQYTLDTIFRPDPKSHFISEGVINVAKLNFMGKKHLISKFNKKTYSGKCSTCKEMCGMNIGNNASLFPDRMPIIKQLSII